MIVPLFELSLPSPAYTMPTDRFRFPAQVDHDTVQSVGKLLLATLALIWLLYLASILPGVDRVIPGTPVTFAAIAGAIATISIVSLLLYLAPTLADLVRSTIAGPAQVVDHVASIIHLFVVLVAVLVAHRGLAPLFVPILEQPIGVVNAGWLYDILFLALALPPLAILAARVYVSLDPISELLADKVTRASDETDDPSPRTDTIDVEADGGDAEIGETGETGGTDGDDDSADGSS